MNNDLEVELPSVSQSETSVDDGSPDNESRSHGKRSKPTSAISHLLKNVLIEEEENTDSLDVTGTQRVLDGRSNTQIAGSASDCLFRSTTAFTDSEPKEYLEEHVFPTLLPGIEMLLKKIKRKDGHLDEETTDPVNWLAQYLMRHNPSTPKLEHEDDQLQLGRTPHPSCQRGTPKSASATA